MADEAKRAGDSAVKSKGLVRAGSFKRDDLSGGAAGSTLKRRGSIGRILHGVFGEERGSATKAGRRSSHDELVARFQLRTDGQSNRSKRLRAGSGDQGTGDGGAPGASRGNQAGDPGMDDAVGNVEEAPPFFIVPDSRGKLAFDLFILALVAVTVVVVPFQVSFVPAVGGEPYELTVLMIVVDVAFAVDIILNFYVTHALDDGSYEEDGYWVRRRYLKTWFIVDLPASVPFEVFAPLFIADPGLRTIACFRLFRLLRVGRVARHFGHLTRASTFRIVYLYVVILVMTHWLACAWFLLLTAQPPSRVRPWLARADLEVSSVAGQSQLSELYVGVYHAAFSMMAGNLATPPATAAERIFTIGAVLIGAVAQASIFGSVAAMISNFDRTTQEFNDKRNYVDTRMRQLNLPPPLRSRIHQYYSTLWLSQRSLGGDPDAFVSELSPALASEVRVTLFQHIVRNAPFFQVISPPCIAAIVARLDTVLFLAGDYLIREGEHGDWMGFVGRGSVDVVRDGKVIRSLGEHMYIGEDALLKGSAIRETSVVAASAVRLHVLSTARFREIEARYKRDAQLIRFQMKAYMKFYDKLSPSSGMTVESFALLQQAEAEERRRRRAIARANGEPVSDSDGASDDNSSDVWHFADDNDVFGDDAGGLSGSGVAAILRELRELRSEVAALREERQELPADFEVSRPMNGSAPPSHPVSPRSSHSGLSPKLDEGDGGAPPPKLTASPAASARASPASASAASGAIGDDRTDADLEPDGHGAAEAPGAGRVTPASGAQEPAAADDAGGDTGVEPGAVVARLAAPSPPQPSSRDGSSAAAPAKPFRNRWLDRQRAAEERETAPAISVGVSKAVLMYFRGEISEAVRDRLIEADRLFHEAVEMEAAPAPALPAPPPTAPDAPPVYHTDDVDDSGGDARAAPAPVPVASGAAKDGSVDGKSTAEELPRRTTSGRRVSVAIAKAHIMYGEGRITEEERDAIIAADERHFEDAEGSGSIEEQSVGSQPSPQRTRRTSVVGGLVIDVSPVHGRKEDEGRRHGGHTPLNRELAVQLRAEVEERERKRSSCFGCGAVYEGCSGAAGGMRDGFAARLGQLGSCCRRCWTERPPEPPPRISGVRGDDYRGSASEVRRRSSGNDARRRSSGTGNGRRRRSSGRSGRRRSSGGGGVGTGRRISASSRLGTVGEAVAGVDWRRRGSGASLGSAHRGRLFDDAVSGDGSDDDDGGRRGSAGGHTTRSGHTARTADSTWSGGEALPWMGGVRVTREAAAFARSGPAVVEGRTVSVDPAELMLIGRRMAEAEDQAAAGGTSSGARAGEVPRRRRRAGAVEGGRR